MTSPFADSALISCLESIRDVAHDLALEIHRAKSGHGVGVTSMVAHIEHQAKVALRLIDAAQDRGH